MDKLTQLEKDLKIAEFTRKHHIMMTALIGVLDREGGNPMNKINRIDELKTSVDLFVYDVDAISEMMFENMELLWQIKDNGLKV